ncbi:putative ankyrin repeat protein RF_0381 [Nasonia vitripennis]|uniref:Ankyrin repeat domain-containing protein n=1 Tax=Nasonia vitripennis TaxID=7425 RepID=A0A7M7HEG4_NASVI|nr:putative ankyrin repeat protein RF_0381 [Nasonia vitripennis]
MSTVENIQRYYEIKFHIRERNSKEALAMLKKYPSQSSFYNVDGSTHLHSAVFEGLLEVSVYLMKNGCDVNFVDNQGNTALTIAMQNLPFERDSECIYYLLYYGANLAHKNKAGLNALRIFAQRNCFNRRQIHDGFLHVINTCDLSDMEIAALLYEAYWPISAVLKIQRPNVISMMKAMGAPN